MEPLPQVLPEVETDTETKAEVDYSLIERNLQAAIVDLPLGLAEHIKRLASSADIQIIELTINAIPQILRSAIATGNLSNQELDVLRDTWKELMTSKDEDCAYIAQEEFILEQDHLTEHDVTTHGWLRASVNIEWFDG